MVASIGETSAAQRVPCFPFGAPASGEVDAPGREYWGGHGPSIGRDLGRGYPSPCPITIHSPWEAGDVDLDAVEVCKAALGDAPEALDADHVNPVLGKVRRPFDTQVAVVAHVDEAVAACQPSLTSTASSAMRPRITARNVRAFASRMATDAMSQKKLSSTSTMPEKAAKSRSWAAAKAARKSRTGGSPSRGSDWAIRPPEGQSGPHQLSNAKLRYPILLFEHLTITSQD
jgi:hypothetical protein